MTRQSLQLGYQLELRQEQSVGLGLGIDMQMRSELHEVSRTANSLWNRGPHHRAGITARELTDLLNSASTRPIDLKSFLDLQTPVINSVFVVISPEEMEKISPGERVGANFGDYQFISNDTPEEYRPFIILHLAVLKLLKSNAKIMRLLEEAGFDFDLSKHWSASFIDIMAATAVYKDSPEQLQQYLRWRRHVERTDFFENEELMKIAQKDQKLRRHRRLTPPRDRSSKWVRRSWNISGMISQLSPEFIDRNYRMLGVTKADVIYFRLAQSEHFDPNKMVQLLRRLESLKRTSEIVDLRDDPELDMQAGLLTHWNLLTADLLQDGREQGTYKLRPFAIRSVSPLIDRICSMFSYALSQASEGNELVDFLINRSSLRLDSFVADETRMLEVDDLNEESLEEMLAWIDRSREQVLAKQQEADELLTQTADSLSGFEEVLPQHTQNVTYVITDMKAQLDQAAEDLERQRQMVIQLSTVREKAEEILKASVVFG